MNTDTQIFTIEDLINSDYEEIIKSYDTKECSKYARKFLQKSRELEASDDLISYEIFILFSRLCSLHLQSESALNPFSPMPSGPLENDPLSSVQIFSQDHIDFLQSIVTNITDHELKSRIADVIWVINRDYLAAELAISAYLESAKILEHPEEWTSCERRIKRAFRLGTLLGSKNEYIPRVIDHIEKVLNKYDGNDPLFLSEKLMNLLLEVNHGDPEKYAKLSEKCAIDAEKNNNFHRARAYWQVKAKWHVLQNDTQKERESLLRNAETYVKEAEYKLEGQNASYLVASNFLQRAIEAYRRIGNTKELVNEIHGKLLQYEQESIKEMQNISVEIDSTEPVRKAIEGVSGKSFYDALFSLSLMVQPPKIERLKEEVIDLANKYPVQHLVSGVIVNRNGKVIGRQASIFSNDPKEVDEAMRQNMLRHAEFHRNFITQSIIEPARHHILLEHNPQLTDFIPIVYDNPFIPETRELIFSKGLLSGLLGDFIEAAHLLIPQIENSLRFILGRQGGFTSSINSDGIQRERNLNDILYASEIEEVFGEDTIFDLQGLLVEKFGANLRHRMAHGLIDYTGFFTIHVSYLWALTLRLCCWPLIINKYSD